MDIINNLGCKYVNKQGPKKGQECGASCRGDYCHRHKVSAIEGKKRYYQKIKNKLKNHNLPSQNVTKRPESAPNQPNIIGDMPAANAGMIDNIVNEQVAQYKAKVSPQPKPNPKPSPKPSPKPMTKPFIRIFGSK